MQQQEVGLKEVEKVGIDGAGCGAGAATHGKPPC